MKNTLQAICLCLLPALANAGGSSIPPYTFIGRIMNATHEAFDDNKVATISAYDGNGTLVAQKSTFFYANSRSNYNLPIPIATEAVDGFVVQATQLTLSVVDDEGYSWEGIVPLSRTIVGEPGGVAEIDIVLCSDLDGDGIDDALYLSLYDEWYANIGAYDPEATFNPFDDHDGDGISTLDEALSGTDPFDADDTLRITSFTHTGSGDSLTFNVAGARAYVVETSTNLAENVWTAAPFSTTTTGEKQSVLAVPSTVRSEVTTVYLLPSDSDKLFYRVKTE